MNVPDYTNLHGHIIARPDGIRVACHGIRLCRHCQGERAALEVFRPGFEANVQRIREMSTALIFSRRWAGWWKDAAKVWLRLAQNALDSNGASPAPSHYDDCAILRGKGDCDCKEVWR